jgi:hypothetical protein
LNTTSYPRSYTTTAKHLVVEYYQALVGYWYETQANLISRYALSLEKAEKRNIALHLEQFETKDENNYLHPRAPQPLQHHAIKLNLPNLERIGAEWAVDCAEVSYQELDLEHLAPKEEKIKVRKWLAIYRKEGHWKINYNRTIDDHPLGDDPQMINGLSVRPTRVNRYTDRLHMIYSVRNDNTLPVFWGWAGTRFILNFDGSSVKDDGNIAFDANHDYPDAWIEISGKFLGYPASIDMTQWTLAAKEMPNLPGFGASWFYHFDLVYEQPNG